MLQLMIWAIGDFDSGFDKLDPLPGFEIYGSSGPKVDGPGREDAPLQHPASRIHLPAVQVTASVGAQSIEERFRLERAVGCRGLRSALLVTSDGPRPEAAISASKLHARRCRVPKRPRPSPTASTLLRSHGPRGPLLGRRWYSRRACIRRPFFPLPETNPLYHPG
ncbi:hypothetical protein N657DRAFT_708899 [Parathielavia appendiculata]|uniref:Uncharacterized protein n=1 Tax=Parathielavia appendiculata TaxID=2587402 RepID=A0AAN6U3J2_9PEZI|nr:hypothetical protein N657DRAFT_708899 [Parathielavia appendiculata]